MEPLFKKAIALNAAYLAIMLISFISIKIEFYYFYFVYLFAPLLLSIIISIMMASYSLHDFNDWLKLLVLPIPYCIISLLTFPLIVGAITDIIIGLIYFMYAIHFLILALVTIILLLTMMVEKRKYHN